MLLLQEILMHCFKIELFGVKTQGWWMMKLLPLDLDGNICPIGLLDLGAYEEQ